MSRLAPEIVAVALLAACSTYEELAPLPPDLPIDSVGGSAGAGTSTSGGPSASGAPSGGSPSMGGSSSPVGGAASGSGPALGGTASGSPPGGAGQGGMPNGDCAECAALRSALVHRYDFEGEGTAVMDRVGAKHGTVEGAELSKLAGKGVVVLTGGTDGPYVDLPNGLVSARTSVTLETWLTWGGGDAWQRIFDFGSSSAAENTPGDGQTYLFVTPTTGADGVVRGVYSIDGGAATAETRVNGTAALPQTLSQVVLVVDGAAQLMKLYVNGESAGEQPFTGTLAGLEDVNCWLGRSQYDADPELGATLHDFRVYGAALTGPQIAKSFMSGPDPAFLAE